MSEGGRTARTFWADASRDEALAAYRALADTIDDGLCQLDVDGRFVAVNDVLVDLLGPSREDLLGKKLPALVDDDSEERVSHLLRERHANPDDEVATLDVEARRASGEPVPVELRVNTLADNGEVTGFVGVVRERQREPEREQRFEQYETIIETMSDGIYVKDEDGRFTMVNQAYAEMTGYSRDELVGAHASLVVDESAIDESRQRIETPEEAPSSMEAALETADGDSVPAEATFATVETDGERREVGVVRDISQRKEYERRLEESERRYRTLVENFPNGSVGLFDESLTYTAVGGELLEGLDIEPEDRVGMSIYELHDDELASLIESHFEAALDGETTRFEVEFRGKHLHVTVLPVGEWAGDAQGMILVRDVTEQREMEQELRESEARFRMLAENLEEIFWMTGSDGDEFRYVNPAYETVWGRDREELYEDPTVFLDYVHEDDRERVREAFGGLPDEEFDEEYRIVRPDGDVRWIHARGKRVHDSTIEMERVVGIGQDVTNRKEREQELERALDLLERTEEVADVGGWEIDTETMDIYWSDNIFDVLQVEADEEPPLEDALDMYHEADRPIVEAAIEEALEHGEPFDIEARIFTTEGDIRWLRLQGEPDLEDGEVVSLRGAAQNITERKERERTLQMQAHQQSVVAELGEYALEVDDLDELMKVATLRVADVLDNDYCKVLELNDEERHLLLRQGVGWRDGIVGSATVDADDNSQAGYTLLSQEPVVVEDLETETRFSGPDLLTSHDVRSGISTIIGSVDKPWGILGTHDTERRTFSEEDVAFVQAVANILAEAIERDRYNAELERTIRELEESNERLEQFAYAASHDLQEPLRMVSSYLSLIERRYEDVLDEDGLEFIEYAVDGAERMREMIDALLAYSRVDTRGNPFEPVDLESVMESVLADYQVKIEETDATITTTDLPTVYGDEDQLRQVFGNLISNALEYSGDGPPTVRVFAEREDDRSVIGVEDEGIGINPEHEDRIFEVFHRLHTPEEYGGTGIGLALAERIVERHDGDIWVESEPGEGSTFYCSLPVVEETNDQSP